MPIRVDAYTEQGVASGVLPRSGYLRDILEAGGTLTLERVTWQSLEDGSSRGIGEVTLAIDDVIVAVGDDDPSIPVHASWHAINLDAGPYRIEGEMPTLPGFDPGRALTRPTGEFVMLRDVRMTLVEVPGSGTATVHHALVNRYAVERVVADLMLGFFFPGAVMEGAGATERAATTPSPASVAESPNPESPNPESPGTEPAAITAAPTGPPAG